MAGTSLSQKEVWRLEEGLPSLEQWGSDLLVPFEARRLKNVSVLWLNRRWFLERGFDIYDPSLRQRIERWLCDAFGFAVPCQDDPPAAYSEETHVLHADRYGGSSSTNKHGGSGRAAVVGKFQVKGIGQTPLTGKNCDWVHSHGCASVEEAVREAIYGEVAAAEFPYGAVPVIAILDAGLCYSRPIPEIPEERLIRRALIIRPVFLRPAHAERAPMFLASQTGYVNSQASDAKRCRDFIAKWLDLAQTSSNHEVPDVEELVVRVAKQAAFGQVHRLYNGGFFSSNITIDGALVDFGGMRPLRSWANARMTHHSPGFGDEMDFVRGLVRSLVFHFGKFADARAPHLSEQALIKLAENAYEKAFNHECVNLLGLHAAAEEVRHRCAELLRGYFSKQQRTRITYATRNAATIHWIYNVLEVDVSPQTEQSYESEVIEDIDAELWREDPPGSDPYQRRSHAWITAGRYLKPRYELDRDALQKKTFQLISGREVGSLPDADAVNRWIRCLIGEGRRHWPHLPEYLTVVSHAYSDGCSVLLCLNWRSNAEQLWIEGIKSKERLWLFDARIAEEDLEDCDLRIHGKQWSACLPRQAFNGERMYLMLGKRMVFVPPFQAMYSRPAKLHWGHERDGVLRMEGKGGLKLGLQGHAESMDSVG
jgi:hypothetical protein